MFCFYGLLIFFMLFNVRFCSFDKQKKSMLRTGLHESQKKVDSGSVCTSVSKGRHKSRLYEKVKNRFARESQIVEIGPVFTRIKKR